MKKIRVEGYNLDRFLDEILSSGIKPSNLNRLSHNELEIDLSDKDYKKLVVKKNISCYNISVVSSKPSHPLILNLFKRAGVLIGLAFAGFVIAVATSKIWRIEINVSGAGSEAIKQEVEQILKENGVEVGSTLSISYGELQNKLLSRIEESSAVLVKQNGTELLIDISLRVEKSEMEQSDIVAMFDGLITDIDHTSGILTVNIGEGVTKGQVLIASGFVGDYFAEAKGEVRARVLISGEAVGSTVTQKAVRTGEFKVVEGYEILGKTYYFDFDGNFQNLYQNHEIEKEEVFVSQHIALPIKKVKFKVFEVAEVEELIAEGQLLDDLKNKAYNFAKSSLPTDAEEISVKYDIFNENGFYKVVCNIGTIISIGKRV